MGWCVVLILISIMAVFRNYRTYATNADMYRVFWRLL